MNATVTNEAITEQLRAIVRQPVVIKTLKDDANIIVIKTNISGGLTHGQLEAIMKLGNIKELKRSGAGISITLTITK